MLAERAVLEDVYDLTLQTSHGWPDSEGGGGAQVLPDQPPDSGERRAGPPIGLAQCHLAGESHLFTSNMTPSDSSATNSRFGSDMISWMS